MDFLTINKDNYAYKDFKIMPVQELQFTRHACEESESEMH